MFPLSNIIFQNSFYIQRHCVKRLTPSLPLHARRNWMEAVGADWSTRSWKSSRRLEATQEQERTNREGQCVNLFRTTHLQSNFHNWHQNDSISYLEALLQDQRHSPPVDVAKREVPRVPRLKWEWGMSLLLCSVGCWLCWRKWFNASQSRKTWPTPRQMESATTGTSRAIWTRGTRCWKQPVVPQLLEKCCYARVKTYAVADWCVIVWQLQRFIHSADPFH